MGRRPKDVTDAELSVLQALWDDGPSTIRARTERLYPGGGASHYATVQKLLERLEAKGCVGRRAGPRAHVYSARVDRDVLIGRQLKSVADQLCQGSLTPLLTHLVRASDLGDEDLDTLRSLVERIDEQRRPRPRKGGKS